MRKKKPRGFEPVPQQSAASREASHPARLRNFVPAIGLTKMELFDPVFSAIASDAILWTCHCVHDVSILFIYITLLCVPRFPREVAPPSSTTRCAGGRAVAFQLAASTIQAA